ncbi:LacI family DNA-binding transcriptional regulator [Pararhodobacter zhoushanensis]|uniref:LacI family DNA-binding transcriptional regulator n=1 Tax=Pararhodobacter zhoushanensis TaxID=2479545 RepID=UPI000F8F5D4B|nr:LacI family DNA-binding transcriptional regulator [Pararhodobacter zhoushanensis]
MNRPTLHDVARAAGVSYATADRVVNARGGVADKSILRVQQAIESLGYERDIFAANLSRKRVYRFLFILPKGDHSFFSALRLAVDSEAVLRLADRVRIDVIEVPALDSDALAEVLENHDDDCDCMAVVATESPRVAAAITAMRERGIAVVTLVGDTEPEGRAAYVGIDNVVAGATAGRLLRIAHRDRPGLILPVLGSLSARDHRQRLEGFLPVLAETPALRALPAVPVNDRRDLMRERVLDAISAAGGDPITGIYSIGGGNRGLIEVLESLQGPRPFVVMHDITPTSYRGLMRGLVDAVIDQKPAQEVALAIDVMKAIADGRDWSDPARQITPTIYLKDNLPDIGGQGDIK